MADRLMKYNPAFLKEEELVRGFVVRHEELGLVMRVIRENTSESNQHMLVTGSRGIGKTTLVLRAVAEVGRDEELSKLWYPIVFGEESYQVKTAGEFWLEALFHLRRQTKEERFRRAYEELSEEVSEDRLRERALGELMDFADEQGKRLLLVVENLNMLVDEQMKDDDAWKLRETLLHEKRVMLLATATQGFAGVENYGKAMFELFRMLELAPLNEDECRVLWEAVTGVKLARDRIRPIQILTGGSPRLLTIISTFGKGLSFKELMDDLMRLVDDHTEYFKSHLDSLPAVERSVYLALAELWDQSTAREVAKVAREDVNKTSMLLNRLVKRGAVTVVKQKGRTKWYQVAERMYNIYYLMRRRGAPSRRVRWVVQFIITFYGGDEIVEVVKSIANEACQLEGDDQEFHRLTLEHIWENLSDQTILEKCKKAIPESYHRRQGDQTGPSGRDICGKKQAKSRQIEEVRRLVAEAQEKRKNDESPEEIEQIYLRCIESQPDNADLWHILGDFQANTCKKYDEAEKAYRQGLEIEEDNVCLLISLGKLLSKPATARYEEAYGLLKQAVQINAECFAGWMGIGYICKRHLSRFEEAEEAYRKAIKLKPKKGRAYAWLGELLHTELHRFDEAERMYRKAVELESTLSFAWGMLGELLCEKFDKYCEAEDAYRKALELHPDSIHGWMELGHLLYEKMERYGEAEDAYRKAIGLKEDHFCAWFYLGRLLSDKNVGKYEYAEGAYMEALRYKKNDASIWQEVIRLQFERTGTVSKVLAFARECARKQADDWEVFNAIAWAFFKEGQGHYLKEAEVWAQKAVQLQPDYAGTRGTYSCILAESGKGKKTLKHVGFFVRDRKLVEQYMGDAMAMFIAIAASGYGRQGVEILERSASAKLLEPLIVGLQLYLGDDVKSAVEIVEVGKDVVKRIEKKKKELEEAGGIAANE